MELWIKSPLAKPNHTSLFFEVFALSPTELTHLPFLLNAYILDSRATPIPQSIDRPLVAKSFIM